MITRPFNIFLKAFIIALMFIHRESKAQADPDAILKKYMTNSWIVVKATIDDSMVSIPCIMFFHKEGKYGAFCKETNEIIVSGKWAIKGNKLIADEHEEKIEFNVLEKTTTTITIQRILKGQSITFYCEWK